MCVCVCASARVCAFLCVCVSARVRMCVLACVRACMHSCARSSACVRARRAGWQLLMRIGKDMRELGRFDEAAEYMRRAVRLAPGTDMFHLELARREPPPPCQYKLESCRNKSLKAVEMSRTRIASVRGPCASIRPGRTRRPGALAVPCRGTRPGPGPEARVSESGGGLRRGPAREAVKALLLAQGSGGGPCSGSGTTARAARLRFRVSAKNN